MYSTKVRVKSIGKMKQMRLFAVLLVPVIALILGAAAPQVWARGHFCVLELDEAEVFFEFNSTDDDRGIQFFWDGEPWKWMRVKNESGRAVLNVRAQRNVRAQGLTEGFFESAEPTSDELPANEFFARFPEGEYTFVGRTLDGCWLVGSSILSHVLPDPPDIIFPIEEDTTFGQFVIDPSIEWNQDLEVEEYEVVAEMEIDGSTFVNTATLPGTATKFTVSPEFVELAAAAEEAGTLEVFKVEVIARANLNKTITEVVVFELEEE
jgi:hypothetical protein